MQAVYKKIHKQIYIFDSHFYVVKRDNRNVVEKHVVTLTSLFTGLADVTVYYETRGSINFTMHWVS
jgi:hypothetical protein